MLLKITLFSQGNMCSYLAVITESYATMGCALPSNELVIVERKHTREGGVCASGNWRLEVPLSGVGQRIDHEYSRLTVRQMLENKLIFIFV